MSQVEFFYPHLIPGLCGALECPRICSRVCHCEAGQRRSRRLLAAQAVRRFTVRANSQQERVCKEVHDAGLCPSLCNQCGGCFMPQPLDHPSEAKRKVFRAQRCMDALVDIRQKSNIGKECVKCQSQG